MGKLAISGGLYVLTVFGLLACNPGSLVDRSEQSDAQDAQRTAQVETVVFSGTHAATVAALQATADSAIAMETQLAQLQREHENLLATIDAIQNLGVTPQAQIVTASAQSISPTTANFFEQYIGLQTASGIDSDTGCAIDKRGRFSVTTEAVYLTMVGHDVQANTPHQARWYFGDELRYSSDAWLPDQDYGQICIYFWLEPGFTTFEVGLWRAELFVDNQFMAQVPFEMCAAGDLC
ncbi:MAG TPA: hypothetical protein VJZ27_02915 [Aggregatilineales bacterium]|nr:hypothetical protein [Aggregatilineales bacterium]